MVLWWWWERKLYYRYEPKSSAFDMYTNFTLRSYFPKLLRLIFLLSSKGAFVLKTFLLQVFLTGETRAKHLFLRSEVCLATQWFCLLVINALSSLKENQGYCPHPNTFICKEAKNLEGRINAEVEGGGRRPGGGGEWVRKGYPSIFHKRLKNSQPFVSSSPYLSPWRLRCSSLCIAGLIEYLNKLINHKEYIQRRTGLERWCLSNPSISFSIFCFVFCLNPCSSLFAEWAHFSLEISLAAAKVNCT